MDRRRSFCDLSSLDWQGDAPVAQVGGRVPEVEIPAVGPPNHPPVRWGSMGYDYPAVGPQEPH